jgi:pyrimidine-nucleoside phosphorylase
VRDVAAPAGGFVRHVGAVQVGNAALRLGAGRRDKEDPVDHAVGIIVRKRRGDAVEAGETIAEVHARDDASGGTAADEVVAAYAIGPERLAPERVVLGVLTQ